MNANLNGLPDEAALARLASELFAMLPGEPASAGGQPGAVPPPPVPPPPVPPLVPPPPAPDLAGTDLAGAVPGVLEDVPGVLGEPPPAAPAHGAAGPGWDLLIPPPIPPAIPLAGPEGALADPYAPVRTPEFYFIGPPRHGAATDPLASAGGHRWLDAGAIRGDFPILAERVNGHRLVWLDNAATTQKPQQVIDRLARFYSRENSNVHRGAHELAARATDAYEDARDTVARFLGAPSSEDIVFVRGTTEAINLVAQSWGRANVGAGDEIVISHLEHHANIVPWQLLAEERGAALRVIPVDDSGQIILDEYRRLLTERTRLVAVAHVSNALGTVLPVREVIAAAHDAGARVLVDGAQAVSHMPVDVRSMDPDFYVFSGHKVFGPTGIGALYGRSDVLDAMPPWQGGGNMIRNVTFERTVYQQPPTRFEAGTGSIADAVGLGAALAYVERIGRANIAGYEQELLGYATRALEQVPGLSLVGTAPDKASILSFVLDGYRSEDVGSALNEAGIAVRAGHHCAQPILRRYGLTSTVRAALAMYNTHSEIDELAAVLHGLAGQRGTRAGGTQALI